MNMESAVQDRRQRHQAMNRVTIVGAAVNIVLSALKMVFGIVGQSQALFADGLHSLSDLVSDGIVLLAVRHGNREPDVNHPYGHARIETAASVAMSLLLFLVAVGLIYDALHGMLQPELLKHPGMVALSVAVLSILSKEILYRYTVVVAKRWRSDLLHANAWHHRMDAISSVIVVLGIAGSMMGFSWLDAVGAVLVALMIGKIAWDLAWGGLTELVDTGLEPRLLEDIKTVIREVPGVEELHMLRSRRMGADALVDVHILVSPRISVSEGHQISEKVRTNLIRDFDDINDVIVHIDPEDDESGPLTMNLPPREAVIRDLTRCWEPLAEAGGIDDVVLHYLDGKIHVEVFLPLDLVESGEQARALATEFSSRARASHDNIAEVVVNFR